MYPGQSNTTISVYRKPAMSAAALAFTIKVDGVELQKIMSNDHVILPITPGRHRIQLVMWSRQGSETLHFDVQPGEQVAFQCSGNMTGLLHPITLIRVAPGAGQSRSGTSAGSERSDAAPVAPARYQPPWSQAAQQGAQQSVQPGVQQVADMPQAAGRPSEYRYPQAAGPSEPRILEVVESGQFEEPLGEEIRVIDNRNSGTGVTRSVKASREWTRTLTLGTEHNRTIGGEISGGAKWLQAKGSIESELQRTYSMETSSRHLFEEEITITVPERTSVRLILRWKRIWQRGVVRMDFGDGATTDVPYQVVVNVTFDQSQEDEDRMAS